MLIDVEQVCCTYDSQNSNSLRPYADRCFSSVRAYDGQYMRSKKAGRTSDPLDFAPQAGMMLGSIFWGGVSDSFGRVYPYHATLLLTGIFNLGASYSRSFLELCICMFAVGTAVGGSMPT
jgi:hypothetical protein